MKIALRYILLAGAFIVAIEIPKPLTQTQTPVSMPVRIAYGPSQGFDAIDPELIGKAKERIDMAAYVLSDRRVIEALSAAATRGVKLRIYFDPEQYRRTSGMNPDVLALTHQPNVQARIKAEQNDLMHLKAYAIDGRILRTGSANFSWSGETRQDNDILVVESAEAAANFTRFFEKLWARRDNHEADR